MKLFLTVAVWALTLLSGAGLFWTSNEVQSAEDTLRTHTSDVAGHHDRLAVLNAEWHYLNNPAYLEKLTQVAFNKHSDTDLMILANSSELPEIELALLPVRKPAVPESFKEFNKESAPMLVAEAKVVQPVEVKKSKPRSKPSSNQEFGLILASWTR